MNDDEKVGHYIEMWKQTVTVQQHFNDIEWRIRGLALTAATFALGAAAIAVKDGNSFVAGGVLGIGLLLWYAFYFVDRYWYHPLLKAAVNKGEQIESHIVGLLPDTDLTRSITSGSGIARPRLVRWATLGIRGDREMRSDDKLVWFYRIGAIALAVSAVGLLTLAAIDDSDSTSEPTKIELVEPTETPDRAHEPDPGSPTPSPGVRETPRER